MSDITITNQCPPSALLRGIEALSEQLARPVVDQAGIDPSAALTWSGSEAARQQEMRDWLQSHRIGRPAANDASPLETHKRMWLELVT